MTKFWTPFLAPWFILHDKMMLFMRISCGNFATNCSHLTYLWQATKCLLVKAANQILTVFSLQFFCSEKFTKFYAFFEVKAYKSKAPATVAIKVRQSRKYCFKADVSTCFRLFFGRNWRHQKDVSKLTDL